MPRLKPSYLALLLAIVGVMGYAVSGFGQLGNVTKTWSTSGGTMPVAGETFSYTVTIPNVGTDNLNNVVFSDFPDPLTVLVNGSVVTSNGSVVVGNGAGDSNIVVQIGTLGPGESATITFDVVSCSCIQYPVMIENQGFVNSDNGNSPTDNPDTPTPNDTTETPVEPQGMPQLDRATKACSLQQDVDGGGQLSQNDTLRYTINVPNNGSVPLVGATFSDALDPNTSLVIGSVSTTSGTVVSGNTPGDSNVVVNLGTLAPGQSATITFDVIISGNTTQVTNQGFIDYAGNTLPTDDPNTTAAQDPTVCQVFPPAMPQIQSFKRVSLLVDADGGLAPSPGDTLQYVITISNSGNAPETNVTFNDTLDPQTTLVSGTVTTSQGTVTQGNSPPDSGVSVNVGTVNPNQTVTIRFNATINAGASGTISNQGTVDMPTGSTPTDNPDTPTPTDSTDTPVTPQQTPELGPPTKRASVSVDADGNGAASVGDTLKYTITIPNVGGAIIRDVRFDDPLDPNTTLVTGSVTSSHGTVVEGNGAGDTMVVVDIGDLNPAESATITFEVTINPGTSMVSNQATVTTPSGPTPTDNPDTPTPTDSTDTPVTPQGPPLRPTKTVALAFDADRSGVISPGDTLRYTITIPNVSITAVPDVVLSDFIDPNTTLIPGKVSTSKGSVTFGNNRTDNAVRVEVGTINPGESVTVTFDVTINLGASRIENQAFVDSPVIDRTPTDNPDTDVPNDATTTEVTPLPLPMCQTTFIWRLSGAALLVEFEAGTFDLGGNITKWEWDFGDGGTCSNANRAGCSARFGNQVMAGTPQKPVHIFDGVGRFAVKLTVMDDQGNTGMDTCVFTFGDPPVTEMLDKNANNFMDDAEILTAIDYWISGKPVPNTGGKVIDDKVIKVLIDLWITGEAINKIS